MARAYTVVRIGRTGVGVTVLALMVGCGTGRWEVERMAQQSISGSQPFATLRGDGSTSLVLECAPDGLQLSFRGRFTEPGATLRFDDRTVTVSTIVSRRGEPVIPLTTRVGSETVGDLLVEASKVTVNPGTDEAQFDVRRAATAIRNLGCRK